VASHDSQSGAFPAGPQPGDHADPDRFLPLVYAELRRLAHHYLRQERTGHTLQATALVHEVYLRLAPREGDHWDDRSRFVGIAAHLMRQVLVEYARGRHREKRGGKDQRRVPLDEAVAVIDPTECGRWEALDEALERLARLSARQAQIVELRYFGGLTVDEVADALRISPKTVKRDWSIARAWLRRELTGDSPAGSL
jgi:RNA polymerase sigma factor (TIGR02999 family)